MTSSFYFTTISPSSDIPYSSLEEDLKTIADKYLYVEEQGKNQTHTHLHIIFKSSKYTKTDKYTAYLKKNSCKNSTYVKSPKFITTKYAKNWKTLYKNYLLKESHNKTFDSLTYNGFDHNELKKLFKEASQNNLIKEQIFVSFTKAPYVIYDFFKKLKKPVYCIEYLLQQMIQDDYIVHHLYSDRKISQIGFALNALHKKNNPPNAVLSNFFSNINL